MSVEDVQYRSVMILVYEGQNSRQVIVELKSAYAYESPLRETIYRWFNYFKVVEPPFSLTRVQEGRLKLMRKCEKCENRRVESHHLLGAQRKEYTCIYMYKLNYKSHLNERSS